MKKILYSLIAVLAMVMSSCSNDDIEVIKTGGVTFNVSTQGVYDDFDVSDKFKSKYLSGSYNIGVYTFVYDEIGNLVTSDSINTQTFGSIECNFSDLKVGKYTAIFVDMLVDGDNNYQSDVWRIIGKEKLSTLEIVHKEFLDKSTEESEKSYAAEWQTAVGYAAKKIEIEQTSDNVYQIVPKGLGAIINTTMTNFSKSNYKALFFYTKNQPAGRFLNPDLSGDDRFHYTNYTGERVWTHRGGAWWDEVPDPYYADLYLLEEGDVLYCFGPHLEKTDGTLDLSFYAYPNGETTFSVRDGNTYYGGFHYLGGSDNRCTAGMFDSWDNYLTWYKSLTTVNTLLPDLYMTWDSSVENVQSFYYRLATKLGGINKVYTMILGKQGEAILMSDGSYEIDYKGIGKESLISYSFKTQTTGLFEVDVRYSKNVVTKNEIMNYLTANYTYVTSQDETYMYMSSDGKTVVTFFPVADEWDLGFVDMNYLNSSTRAQIKNNPKAFLKAYVKK